MQFNPQQKYRIESKTYQIEDFHRYAEEFITRPPYQRKTVWSVKKKQSLMDSLFRRYYVPKLVIREVRISDDKTIHEIIDGQQRITTVQSFFNDEYKLPPELADIHPELAGAYYKDLNSELRRFIDREIKFEADIVTNIDNPRDTNHQKIATEIFWRLQQGESLNFMEVAHANLSSLSRNVLVKYSDDIAFNFETYRPIDHNKNKHKFFNLINMNNNRMQHLKLFSRFLIIEDENKSTPSFVYPELNDKSVTSLVQKYVKVDGVGDDSLEDEDFVKNCLSNLTAFYNILKDDYMLSEETPELKELSSEYFIISFYLLLRHLRKYYAINEDEKKILNSFFFAFHKRWNAKEESDLDIMIFSNNRQQGPNNLEIRDRICREMFFTYLNENNHEFILKDSNRAFNEAQRISIYRRDKGICQDCINSGLSEKESTVSWDQHQADHVIPHTRGGSTSEDNAQVLCTRHNAKKGARV